MLIITAVVWSVINFDGLFSLFLLCLFAAGKTPDPNMRTFKDALLETRMRNEEVSQVLWSIPQEYVVWLFSC